MQGTGWQGSLLTTNPWSLVNVLTTHLWYPPCRDALGGWLSWRILGGLTTDPWLDTRRILHAVEACSLSNHCEGLGIKGIFFSFLTGHRLYANTDVRIRNGIVSTSELSGNGMHAKR